MRLTSIADFSIQKLWPCSAAAASRARTSLGKQEPPNPSPALRKARPTRGSSPMPSATAPTSAPVSSQRWAISLMNEIFRARKVLVPYLTISALVESVMITGAWRWPKSAATRSQATRSSPPTTMRVGLLKSSIAEPSRRNSGQETRGKPAASREATMLAVVPGGIVDLIAITAPRAALAAALATASRTWERSASPSSAGGVPTAIMTMPASRTPTAMSPVTCTLPAACSRWSISSSPGSWIGQPPAASRSRRRGSISTRCTVRPESARQIPVTSPT